MSYTISAASNSGPGAQRTGFRLALWLAWGAALLTFIAAAAGVFSSGLYQDAPALIPLTRANDAFILIIGLPVLIVALWGTRRGSLTARAVTIGALGSITYNYAVVAFSAAINALTLVHVGIVGLTGWAMLLLYRELDAARIEAVYGDHFPRRWTAALLLVMALITVGHWGADIMTIVNGGTGTLATDLAAYGWSTNPLITLDLAFVLPLWLVAAWGLLRREAGALRAGLVQLIFLTLLGLGLLALPVLLIGFGEPFDVDLAVVGGMFFALPALLLLRVFLPRRTVAARGQTAHAH